MIWILIAVLLVAVWLLYNDKVKRGLA